MTVSVRLCVFYILIPTAWIPHVYGKEDVKYMGCYKEPYSARLLRGHSENLGKSATVKACLDLCRNKNFRYAGAEWSVECFCSNERPSYHHSADEEDCNYRCGGDETKICGGDNRITVFDTKGLQETVNAVETQYMGCFADSAERLLNMIRYDSDLLTPEFCVGYCYRRGYRFAGLELKKECYCGDTLRMSAKVDNAKCSSDCEGEKSFKCGGVWLLSVYHTGIPDLPENKNLIGCYDDNFKNARVLTAAKLEPRETNTPRRCMNICLGLGYKYAGTEYRTECFCGNERPPVESEVEEKECHLSCPGNPKEFCGAIWRILVYSTGKENVKYMGCYKDLSGTARLLREYSENLGKSTTVEACLDLCRIKEFRYAGVEWSVECFCSNERPSYHHLADEEDCNYKCGGDETKICGGDSRINVFDIRGLQEKVNAVNTQYVGCFVDTAERMLNMVRYDSDLLTPEFCVGYCYRRGYRFAGLELKKECYCGDTLRMSAKVDDAKCSSDCEGEKSFKCGGVWLLSVYHTGIPDVPEKENLIGCYNDNFKSVRLLSATKLELRESNTPRRCMNICLGLGYKYAGTEFRVECFCGNKRPPVESQVEDNECHLPCPGNPKVFCGATWRILVYSTGIGNVDASIPEIGIENPMILTSQPPSIVEAQSPTKCEPSVTTVNDRNMCKGELIFTEDFSSNQLDLKKWSRKIYMPYFPDYEFVTFTDSLENTYIKNGKLYIKPTVMEDDFVKTGKIELQYCTGQPYSEECKRQGATYNILPPISSGKICTKDFFSFQYGIVQMTVKLPIGDWIVPEILLEPKRNSYGSGYSSGKVRIAMARGNRHLTVGTSDIGNNRVKSGVIMAHLDNAKELSVIRDKTKEWHDRFHNFTLVWSPENFAFLIDGNNEEKFISSEGKKLCRIVGFNEHECETWEDGALLAPFDKEFYLSIGLSVGGMRDFPDGSISSNAEKPWKDFQVKAMANFWRAKESWLPTWNDEESALQVDSIRIYAL